MALSFHEVLDPDKIEAEVAWWEDKIDTHLKQLYFDGNENEYAFGRHLLGTGDRQLRPVVGKELIQRYTEAGWNLSWDNSVTQPWFVVRPLNATGKRKNRWWEFGRY